MKSWKIEFERPAAKVLQSLDPQFRKKIKNFLDSLDQYSTPRAIGEPLSGPQRGLWRYRVGDYRLICEFKDKVLTIVVVRIGHRREVYKFH